MVSKEKDMSKLGQELEKLQAQSTTDQANHDSAQKHYQAVSAGLSSNTDGEAASLNDQLMSKSTHWKNVVKLCDICIHWCKLNNFWLY